MFDLLSLAVGFGAGSLACALSAKYLGWFNKQVAAVEKKV
jgi:hypothetical protein